jgi:hypothetical protein
MCDGGEPESKRAVLTVPTAEDLAAVRKGRLDSERIRDMPWGGRTLAIHQALSDLGIDPMHSMIAAIRAVHPDGTPDTDRLMGARAELRELVRAAVKAHPWYLANCEVIRLRMLDFADWADIDPTKNAGAEWVERCLDAYKYQGELPASAE